MSHTTILTNDNTQQNIKSLKISSLLQELSQEKSSSPKENQRTSQKKKLTIMSTTHILTSDCLFIISIKLVKLLRNGKTQVSYKTDMCPKNIMNRSCGKIMKNNQSLQLLSPKNLDSIENKNSQGLILQTRIKQRFLLGNK